VLAVASSRHVLPGIGNQRVDHLTAGLTRSACPLSRAPKSTPLLRPVALAYSARGCDLQLLVDELSPHHAV
jgi:hypothetical protein